MSRQVVYIFTAGSRRLMLTESINNNQIGATEYDSCTATL